MDYRILGPLEIVDDGHTLTPARPKQRALLALLLLHVNQVVASDELLDALWGDEHPETAQTALRGHVSALRKLLGSDTIETRSPGYLLRLEPDRVDLGRFERLVAEARTARDPARRSELLRSALALFRGEPLADFRYEPFARDEAGRIEQLRLAALEDAIDAELALGREAGVVSELERLVAANPLRERLRGELMLALYRLGRQAEALEAYRQGRQELAAELGLDPGPGLRELERKILSHDPSLARPTGRAERPGPPARVRRRRVLAALAVLALVGAAAAVAALVRGNGDTPRAVEGDAVAIVDAERGTLVGSVAVASRPGAVAAGAGAVWATLPDRGAVVEIDLRTRAVVDTIPVGADPSGIAVGAGSVWVANAGSSTVSRISPATKEVVQTIDVPGGPTGIAVGRRGVWVVNSVNDSVSRIDPATGRVTAVVPVGDDPVRVAVDGDAVWVTNAADGTATRVDARRNRAVQVVDVGSGPQAVAAGRDAVWVADLLDGTASRIDPGTNAVVQTIRVGDAPTDVAVGDGLVWVADGSQGSVTRLDRRAGKVTTIPLGSQAGGLALADRSLWVSVRGPETAHRGGTLTVLTRNVLDTIDPALAYFSDSWSILAVTGDGLVGYRRVGGLAGSTLVPDLARSIPQPTDGGRRYTFQLRRGLRYSNGDPVRAGDFRRALERVFRLRSGGAFHYAALSGARACTRRPASCDLSSGVIADDAAGTVTFQLVEPDPDFLHRLALPFAFAVPAGTPPRDAGTSPIPATGPYRIERYRRDEEVVLVRNPQFAEWSRAAQPDGFPDRIVWRLGVEDAVEVKEVLAGRADLMFRELPPSLLGPLAASHAGQVHLAPRNGTYFMSLNVETPPFDDARVRRALSFAVDRREIAAIFAGTGSTTCQILPPNFPGYVPYCPFTREPDRTWTAPDLRAARALVRASGTRGARVTVWATPDYAFGIPVPVGRYFVRLLGGLGYRASLKVVGSRDAYFAATLDPTRHVQIAFEGWASDYPAESGFIGPVLTCASRANSGSQFCDPGIDRRMDAATLLQLSDLAAAHRRWTAIEHDLTDLAPWVPLVTRSWVNLVSERVGNFQVSPQWGPLIAGLWVR